MCDSDIEGVHVFKFTEAVDQRGFWTRLFDLGHPCLVDNGLDPFVQMSLSFNKSQGTFRGLHYLEESAREWKFVAIAQGSVRDFSLDLRPDSTTFGEAMEVRLSRTELSAILLPPGVAHGFLTLEDNSSLVYAMTAMYHPDIDKGVNWRSPAIISKISAEPTTVSPRDSLLPLFPFEVAAG